MNGKTCVETILGFEHLDLSKYQDLPDFAPGEEILSGSARVLATEERQRLRDLAEQFESLLGNAQIDENFQFWRRYLRDKVSLQRSHPEYLASIDLPHAGDLAAALDYLAAGKDGLPSQQAEQLADRLNAQPFLVNFLPAVDNQVLLALFTSGANLPQGPTLQATASFVERLERFGVEVDRVLLAARDNPADGADLLAGFIAGTGLEQEDDLKLFFDLFKDSDRDLAGRVVDLTLVRSPEPYAAPRAVTALAFRPDITDRNGILLATSLKGVSLYANPRDIPNPKRAARQLAAILCVRLLC